MSLDPKTSIAVMQELVDRPTVETDGPNRSPWLDALCHEFGVPLGSSWCAMFAGHCFKEAARRRDGTNHFPLTAGSQDLKAKLSNAGCPHTRDGEVAKHYRAIILIRTDPGGAHGHVAAIKERLTDGDGHMAAVITCEGNSNTNGSANGDRAVNHKRFVPLQGDWTFFDVSGLTGEVWYD